MRRSTTGFWLALALPVMSGVIWFAWSAHDFGSSCGFRLAGYPSGPTTTGDILLISMPGLIAAAVQAVQTQSWRRALGYGILAALLSAVALAVAVLFWIASRHCTE